MNHSDTISAIKVMRRMRREEEIALYGKPLRIEHVVASKKTYSRKRKHKRQEE